MFANAVTGLDAARPSLGGARALAAKLPSTPLLTSPSDGWPGLALRHFRHPAGGVSDVTPDDHLLVLHLSAGAGLEEHRDGRLHQAAATPGHASLAPAGQRVSRRWDGPSEVLLLVLGRALVDDAARDLEADPARVELVPSLSIPDGDLERLGRLLLSQAARPAPGAALMVDALARALALHLVGHHSTLAPGPAQSRQTLPPRRVARVIDHMREHLDRPLSVAELAAVAGLSASHVTRAFRDALGTTPHAYLIGLRLAKACEQLAGTDRSITQIALSCGFEQSQHFAVMFRRRYGCTPSTWRRIR